jgi:hypothetical protein
VGGLGSGRRPYGPQSTLTSYYTSRRIRDALLDRWHAPPEIRFTTVPTPAGNGRWLFVCTCGRRCTVLYARENTTRRHWRCRLCHRLTYPSQRQTQRARWERRAFRIRQRVEDWLDPEPKKLPRVHWSTYRRALARAERLERKVMAAEERRWQRQLEGLEAFIATVESRTHRKVRESQSRKGAAA